MKVRRLKAAHRDSRGTITDILDGIAVNSVTILTAKKGSVRGNHFHKRTTQWAYVLRGRIKYVSRKANGGRPASRVLGPGALVVSPPGEAHTIVAVTDAEFLAISAGPRSGKSFESDTFRLADPLVHP